jgi:hypothetical protein
MNLCWHLRFDLKTQSYYAMASERYTDKNGKRKGRSKYLHIEIMNADFSKGEYVDHIFHNRLDNRKKNLRVIQNDQNSTNRKGKNKNNKSGYRNVSKRGKWWVVQLQIEGKNTVLKKFPLDQLKEAGEFAEKMRRKYYREFAGTG